MRFCQPRSTACFCRSRYPASSLPPNARHQFDCHYRKFESTSYVARLAVIVIVARRAARLIIGLFGIIGL